MFVLICISFYLCFRVLVGLIFVFLVASCFHCLNPPKSSTSSNDRQCLELDLHSHLKKTNIFLFGWTAFSRSQSFFTALPTTKALNWMTMCSIDHVFFFRTLFVVGVGGVFFLFGLFLLLCLFLKFPILCFAYTELQCASVTMQHWLPLSLWWAQKGTQKTVENLWVYDKKILTVLFLFFSFSSSSCSFFLFLFLFFFLSLSSSSSFSFFSSSFYSSLSPFPFLFHFLFLFLLLFILIDHDAYCSVGSS